MATPLKESDFATRTSVERSQGAYSLLLLFYLTALAAILLAACRLAFDESNLTTQSLTFGSVISAVIGFLAGSILGFTIGRTALCVTVAAIVCGCFGPIASWLALVGAQNFTRLNVLVLTGCWIIVAAALAANRFSVAGK